MTNEVADEILQQIGMAIGNDPNLYDDWIAAEVVFKVRAGVVGHHAAMYVSGEAEEVSFLLSSENRAKKLVQRLQEATINKDGTIWIACKIDIGRETKEIKIKFEYHDEKRWDTPLPF